MQKKHKLIRDGVAADIIEREGVDKVSTAAHGGVFDGLLREKLIEESNEVFFAQNNRQLIAELGDVYSVMETLAHLKGFSIEQVAAVSQAKNLTHGSFDYQYILKLDNADA